MSGKEIGRRLVKVQTLWPNLGLAESIIVLELLQRGFELMLVLICSAIRRALRIISVQELVKVRKLLLSGRIHRLYSTLCLGVHYWVARSHLWHTLRHHELLSVDLTAIWLTRGSRTRIDLHAIHITIKSTE
jgi:hypothetical protein